MPHNFDSDWDYYDSLNRQKPEPLDYEDEPYYDDY